MNNRNTRIIAVTLVIGALLYTHKNGIPFSDRISFTIEYEWSERSNNPKWNRKTYDFCISNGMIKGKGVQLRAEEYASNFMAELDAKDPRLMYVRTGLINNGTC